MRRGHGGEEETGCESKAAGPGLSPGVFCKEVTERRRQRKSEKERREEENTHGQKNEEGGYPELSGWRDGGQRDDGKRLMKDSRPETERAREPNRLRQMECRGRN